MTAQLRHDLQPDTHDPKRWAREACRAIMLDDGYRVRKLRAMGLGEIDRHDFAGLAYAMRGPIHGQFLAMKFARPWWKRDHAADRWTLIGIRTGLLRLARAQKRRQAFRVV